MISQLLEKLKIFSDSANMGDGGSHPSDQKIFFDLIIQAHHEKSPLDQSRLIELLIDQGWPEEFANDLSSQYSFGRDLLKQYDS